MHAPRCQIDATPFGVDRILRMCKFIEATLWRSVDEWIDCLTPSLNLEADNFSDTQYTQPYSINQALKQYIVNMQLYFYRGLENEKVPKGVTHVIIDNSVTSIKKNAFYLCYRLVYVIMGDNIKRIEYDAFWYCPLTKSASVYYAFMSTLVHFWLTPTIYLCPCT